METTVAVGSTAFGMDRCLAELVALGYAPEAVEQPVGHWYIILRDYEVQIGRFAGCMIDLAFAVPNDYPRSVASALQVRADPQLLPDGHVPNVQNVQASPLGDEWRYWSINFNWGGTQGRSTARFLAQVSGVFSRVGV